MSSVHYDKPGQQEWLVAGAPVDPVWQQDTALSLMVQDEGQQRHDQHKDHGTANHCVRDTGVIVQAIVQSHSVLSWVFCCCKAVLFITVILTVILSIAEETAIYTAAIATVEACG